MEEIKEEKENELQWIVDATSTVSLNLDVDITYVTDSSVAVKAAFVPLQDESKVRSVKSNLRKPADTSEASVVLIDKGEKNRFHTVGTSGLPVCHCSFPVTFHIALDRPPEERVARVSSGFVIQSKAVLPQYSPPQARPIPQSLPSDYFMENEDALRDLYDSLVKVHGFVGPKIQYRRFAKLFGNQNIGKPINWVGHVNALRYFLDALYDAGLFTVKSKRGFWQSAEKCFVVEGKYKKNLRTNTLDDEKVKQQIDKIIANVCIYKAKK